jgi:putative peptidoglycan lipid II flippase
VINLALCLALRHSLGAVGLVVASTTAIVVQTLLLQRALARRVPGMHFGLLWRSVAKVCAATLAMSVVVWAGQYWLAGAGLGRRGDFIAVAGLIPLGMVVYGVVLWLVKIEGHAEFSTLLGKFRAKFF